MVIAFTAAPPLPQAVMNPSAFHRLPRVLSQVPAAADVSVLPLIALPSAAQTVKNPPAMQEMETPARFLGQEDPWEEGVVTYSGILACRIPWTRSLVGYSL